MRVHLSGHRCSNTGTTTTVYAPQFGAAGLLGADDRADSVPPSAEGGFKPDAPYQAFLDTAIEDLLKEKEQVSYATATKAAGTATESVYVYQGVCPAPPRARPPPAWGTAGVPQHASCSRGGRALCRCVVELTRSSLPCPSSEGRVRRCGGCRCIPVELLTICHLRLPCASAALSKASVGPLKTFPDLPTLLGGPFLPR